MNKKLLLSIVFAALCLAAFGQNLSTSYVSDNGHALALFSPMNANGNTVSFNASFAAPYYHTFAWIVTGGPAACTLQLQGSLDNINFFNMGAAQTCTASGMFTLGTQQPVLYVRLVLAALSGGTSPTVTPQYLGAK